MSQPAHHPQPGLLPSPTPCIWDLPEDILGTSLENPKDIAVPGAPFLLSITTWTPANYKELVLLCTRLAHTCKAWRNALRPYLKKQLPLCGLPWERLDINHLFTTSPSECEVVPIYTKQRLRSQPYVNTPDTLKKYAPRVALFPSVFITAEGITIQGHKGAACRLEDSDDDDEEDDEEGYGFDDNDDHAAALDYMLHGTSSMEPEDRALYALSKRLTRSGSNGLNCEFGKPDIISTESIVSAEKDSYGRFVIIAADWDIGLVPNHARASFSKYTFCFRPLDLTAPFLRSKLVPSGKERKPLVLMHNWVKLLRERYGVSITSVTHEHPRTAFPNNMCKASLPSEIQVDWHGPQCSNYLTFDFDCGVPGHTWCLSNQRDWNADAVSGLERGGVYRIARDLHVFIDDMTYDGTGWIIKLNRRLDGRGGEYEALSTVLLTTGSATPFQMLVTFRSVKAAMPETLLVTSRAFVGISPLETRRRKKEHEEKVRNERLEMEKHKRRHEAEQAERKRQRGLWEVSKELAGPPTSGIGLSGAVTVVNMLIAAGINPLDIGKDPIDEMD